MTHLPKLDMLVQGIGRVNAFCEVNAVDPPIISLHELKDWHFKVCAYYRNSTINVCLERCAHIGTGGASWSYPGYVIDRTPYGVLAHELGHHFDVIKGTKPERYMSDFSINLRKASGEEKLTNYCPDDAEWFAEMFRLFVTNPDLLAHLRPITYQLLCGYFKPVRDSDGSIEPWQEIVIWAPERTFAQAKKKVKEAAA